MEYIKSWALSLLATLGLVQPITESYAIQPLKIGSTTITIIRGDITQEKVDAIVNAANENLSHGGGVAGAIAKAAGPQLQQYSDAMPLIAQGKRCPMGMAVITPAFNLKKNGIKKIIHVTGPRGTTFNKEQLLRDAYQSGLQVAEENNIRTIAFPAISTAIFGYDINEATPIAFAAVRDFIKKHPKAFNEVRFILFSDGDLAVYKKWSNELLK
ncbi:MAG TPA: macro domain-containing protein [Candidatus Babeliales bacterium]|nr:macro domain-containing protein [Candidatus Babeliales bacterium]